MWLLPNGTKIKTYIKPSVTRLGDLLDFGNFLKPLATIKLPKSPTFLGNFCKGVKIFKWNHIWATFIDSWKFFSGHTAQGYTA